MIKTIKKMKEDEAQKLIVSWCIQNNLVPVAVPNGFNLSAAFSILKNNGISTTALTAQNAKQIVNLKKEGLHTGFPDLMVFGTVQSSYKILFVENKVKNNKPSPEQIMCHTWLKQMGFDVIVTKNASDGIMQIKSFFGANAQIVNQNYILERKKYFQNYSKKSV